MKRVLVQAGHNPPREPGFEGGTGTAGEIEFVKDVADALLAILKKDPRFEGIYSPGDIPDGIQVNAALFLHADGSASPSASGYSFGYPDAGVNARLARLIGEEFNKIPGHPPHHADNYTGDMHFYYGFSRVDTPGPEVLVEHGFLTNPEERQWLLGHVHELAQAEYRALLRFFGLPPLKRWKLVKDGRVLKRGGFAELARWIKEHASRVKRLGGVSLRRNK